MDTASLGSLVLAEGSAIVVEGHNATIAPKHNNSTRLFYYSNENPSPTITSALGLRNMTLRGFGNSAVDGGTVYIFGLCSASFTSVTFASSVGGNGGAIYMTENSLGLAVDGCSFESCEATKGGVREFFVC